ncbi:TolB-like translocation protein [Anaeromicrobium sediminis]|uniref:Dipeptidylpeptidase IV N-terminal domain-containing protein n=1 Tax=Anaeromicrobium sediminis TaxID=1478221 RepID=A0A267MKC5_9FIRM|nr:PD40 domain-containing protein [Anaeromicrobium sediminis]PAB60051.1 hypothetical protein CCE28_06655 [Anaeromicrobium sediminis]
MRNKGIYIFTLIISLSLFAACGKTEKEGRQVIEKEEKTIIVIDDTKDAVYEDIAIEKIKVYEGMKGFEWVNDEEIIVGKENKELYSKVDGHVSAIMRNLYLYDVETKEEKIFTDKSQYQEYPIVSPDRKHILYVNMLENKGTGYIVDMDGKIKVKISLPYVQEFTEAKWVNNDEIIIPFMGSHFHFVNVDGTTRKIENAEDHMIQYAFKVNDKVYYKTYDKKMKVYDINMKEKILFEDNVTGFYLSPDKKELILSKHLVKEQKDSLILTDLNGKNKEILVEGRFIYGVNWSPDGTKLAYMLNKGSNGDVGFYIMDMKNKIQSFVSTEYFGYGAPIWSPSGKKIMINMDKQENEQVVDTVHILTFK